ncbi:MAG: cyclodeaminase/cyclohydrolase family protein [Vicinamibacterales bacterium]
MTFATFTVQQFLDALASPDPTPGGGTAAAITGAMGASLLIMVAGLAKSRTNSDDEKAALAQARAPLTAVRDRLVQLADADTAAFDEVMGAYRLPKASDEEKAARAAAIERALQLATTAPLETLTQCALGIEVAMVVAANGNRSAASDVGVAIGLLEAAAAGADANVRINLESLKDLSFKTATAAATDSVSARVAAQAAGARARL